MGSSDKVIATKRVMAGILSSGSVLSENQKLPQHFSWQKVYFQGQRWDCVSYANRFKVTKSKFEYDINLAFN